MLVAGAAAIGKVNKSMRLSGLLVGVGERTGQFLSHTIKRR